MKYFFILGRNVSLSVAEILSYFSEKENKIEIHSQKENIIILEFSRKINSNIVNELGGTIAFGEILAEGTKSSIIKQIEKTFIYNGKKNNITYSLIDYSSIEIKEEVSSYLKDRFKAEKLKASEKKTAKTMKLQDSTEIINIPSRNIIDESYLIYEDLREGKEILFGRVLEFYNSRELEKRDMSKPIRRNELAISPRLAKILINLSKIKEGETLLDPFCGVGVILEEALHKKIKVVGIDKNHEAIKGAEKNLSFYGFPKVNYKLLCEDSKTAKINSKISAIATEPHLGELLTKPQTVERAYKITKEFENMIIQVIKNLKNQISGRVVFTSPYIKTIKNIREQNNRIGINVEEIVNKTGLRLASFGDIKTPIEEFRENQIMGRQIFVLEK